MTTLILQAAGSVVGGYVAGPVGRVVGRVLGTAAGAGLDAALFADGGRGGPRVVEGPRLKELDGLVSSEGAPIPRVYGRARIGGELIWATRFLEVATTSVERTRAGEGGKGAPARSAPQGQTTVTTTYSYYANLAVGLCEGPIAFVRRVWADGRELDLTTTIMRVHTGTEDQPPDPLIVAKEGAGNAPAYRGLAYVVFERLAIAPFGNRVPQLSFEVVRPVAGLGEKIRAVCLIPGSTEFGYGADPVMRVAGLGRSDPENVHQLQKASDLTASLDALQALCPNLERVSVVVSWFGDDLRAGACTVAPRVERTNKTTIGASWTCAGLGRDEARVVSETAPGVSAYGGTPSDASVTGLIGELKARGLEVVLYPFLMMDIPAGNALPDPGGGSAGQPPYPWRGRITCDPAPGRPGTVDGTSTAGAQVDAFFGTGAPAWDFRRLLAHYAGLAAAAGGVDGFVIASELVGLTRVRSGPGAYPAVAQLRQLAAEARAILGPATKLVYAADWTEYGAHVLASGEEVRFPLDPLWADPAIDAVGIDYYPPISDWRDGRDHLDAAEARGATDPDYLARRLSSGEAFDWFYASDADRAAQTRSPITDGAYGKPWMFRAKDLAGWWSNPHVERLGGVETAATAWAPAAKPIWLTEIGIPAVNKGANGPNVFPDPKSSESAYPPFSQGRRDDLVQARAIQAILARFAEPGFANPVSPVTGSPMVEPGRIFVWAWDARPFPAFPDLSSVWADAANYKTGHWINGRVEGMTLDGLVAAILADYGLGGDAHLAADGFVDGCVLDRPMSARAALEGLAQLHGIDVVASGGRLAFVARGERAALALQEDDLVAASRAEPALRLVRAQESELPVQVRLAFTDAEGEYRRAMVASRRLVAASRRETDLEVAMVTRRAEAARLVGILLQEAWAGRERAEFALSPRAIALEPGDLVTVPTRAGPRLHRVTRIADGPTRRVSTTAVEPGIHDAPAPDWDAAPVRPAPVPGPPLPVVLDLPAARGEPTALQYLAVAADPWPEAVAVWRSADGASYDLWRLLEQPALIGRTLTVLPPGPLWRWDTRAGVEVETSAEGLASVDDLAALAGRSTFALMAADGTCEILTAACAELVGPRRYRLSRLLRGLAGSEAAAAQTLPAGSLLVHLDGAVGPLAEAPDEIGRTWRYRIGPAARGHADPMTVEVVATVTGAALKPLAPVAVTARRGSDGVTISWIRRTRRDGDSWDAVEVPLAEDFERYEVDVLDGSGAVRRTLASDGPAVLYPAAQENADLGGAQASLAVAVVQISRVVGRGWPRTVTVPVV